MGICNDEICNCALRSATLAITGSGTPGDPWVLEQAEFSDITELQNDVANIEATLATLADTYVNVIGDTMTGALTIDRPAAGGTGLIVRNLDGTPIVSLRDSAGTQQGFFQAQESNTLVRLLASAGYGLVLGSNSIERMRILSAGIILIGKAATDVAVSGIEIRDTGQIWPTVGTTGAANLLANRIGAADANGEPFASFRSSGTQIGTITRATASTVAYNTSSDEEKKQNIRPIPDTQALALMRQIEPFLFEWKIAPTDVTIGYVAQRVAAMWPESIKHGLVTPPDPQLAVDDPRYAGWQMDYSKIVPLLHSAVQAIDRSLTAFKTQAQNQVTGLQSQITALTARVAALEAA